MHLTTAHSLWLAPLCVLLGAALAWCLYRRQQGKEGFPPRVNWLLAVLRAVAVAIIAFFLLEPMLRILVREVRKPVVALLHDGSRSLLLAGDTAALRGSYAERLKRLESELGERFTVRAFTYGDQVTEGLDLEQRGTASDLSQALRELYDRFSGPDLAAVILDGDGIVNRGRDPRYDAERLQVPVFTIALGDTTVRPDLAVRSVEHNRICFLGNEFPVRVRLTAQHLKGAGSRVLIKRGGEVLASQSLAITTDPFVTEVAFSVKADKPGTQRYTVEAEAVDGESGRANNEQDFFIEVLDARQKLLILAAAPHPDLAALRAALSGVEGHEVELAYADGFNGAAAAYDLIVLHQLPGNKADAGAFIASAQAKGIPLLHVIGMGTRMDALNALRGGVRVSDPRPSITDAQAAVARDFGLFILEADLVQALERFPPLQVPFAQYALSRSASALAWQRVGAVRTEAPLIAVEQQEGTRSAAICGEGLWRWRMADYQLNGSHERFDRLIRKLAQFLALKADKKRFRVDHAPVVPANEQVLLNAEVYNAAFEAVPDAEVTIVLKDEEGREYPVAFNAGANGYRANAGLLPAGRYTWQAEAEHQGERMRAQGEVHVSAVTLEQVSTVADHGLLADIAARTGGQQVGPSQLDAIVAALGTEQRYAARSYAQPRFSDLIELRWIFFAVLALLASEWALRRRSGAY
ncbi:MAG: hypothetical protein IPM12_11000 [Flavobacteriales bacterium]|nr:hypothetical protein [Flavobacteriales bacterium]